jgi:hypothetical protein
MDGLHHLPNFNYRSIANSFALTVLLMSLVKSVSTLDHKSRL